MGRPEPAAASSSPSAKLRILSLTRSGTIGERIRVTLSDGSFFSFPETCLPERGLAAGDLEPGVELGEEAVRSLGELARASQVRERALRLLAGGAHSVRGLERKLLARGAEPGLVAAELARLTASGLLDDRAYAEAWVRQRLARHPEGLGLLEAGLRRRGVPRELAAQTVRREVTEEVERVAAAALAGKLRCRSGMTPALLSNTLARRGFRRGLIRELLEE
jgi:regulatory protein